MTSIQKFVTFLLLANVAVGRQDIPANHTGRALQSMAVLKTQPKFQNEVKELQDSVKNLPDGTRLAKLGELLEEAKKKFKAAEKENGDKFSEMEKVCSEAGSQKYDADNLRTTNSKTVDGVTIYMGGEPPAASEADKQEKAMEVAFQRRKTLRVQAATANYADSIRNCQACIKDKSKCAGDVKAGKKAKGETLVEEKVVDGENGDGGADGEGAPGANGKMSYQSHAAQNLMFFGAFASLV